MSIPLDDVHAPKDYIQAQFKIDEEISELERKIIALKVTRNTFAPIARLHTEVLQEIFLLACQSSEPFNRGRTALLLTWISRWWRHLAVNTPTLWTHMDFHDPEWIAESLSRTRGCALEYSFYFTPERQNLDWKQLVPLSIGNLSRIKRFYVLSLPSYVQSCPFPKSLPDWTNSASTLVDLQLQGVTLPSNILSGACPSLQILSLNTCNVDWDTLPGCPFLKELDINRPNSKFTIRSLVKLLGTGQNVLEFLTLTYCHFARLASSRTSSDMNRIRLRQLKTLYLQETDPNSIAVILNQFSLPRYSKVKLYAETWNDSLPETLLSCRETTSWEIDCLEMTLDTTKQRLMVRSFEKTSRGNTAQIGESQFFPRQENQAPSCLKYFERQESVHHLCISLPFIKPFIASLRMQDDHIRSALSTGNSRGISDRVRLLLVRFMVTFPKLRMLEFWDQDNTGSPVNINDLASLRKWLVWRNMIGLRLEGLVIHGLDAGQADSIRRSFSELVGDVKTEEINSERA